MKTNRLILVVLTATSPLLGGCQAMLSGLADAQSNPGYSQPFSALNTPAYTPTYHAYRPPPAPTIRYWAPSGNAAIQAKLMNNIGRR